MHGAELLGDRYELRDVLGFGGMAEVRDGWDTRLYRPVAIKLLHPGMSSQADIRERFTIEARAAAALNHPNIVSVYDFGEHRGTPFIVMERLPGETLGDRITLGPLPQEQVFAALHAVLAALTVAHGAGMLHRDIKPGNILLATSGGMKVADFGIVKAPGSVHTTTGQIVGTLAYLSADRIAGKPATPADDLYAVGVVGYEALTGRRPFTQEEIAPLARAIMEEQPPPMSLLRPDADPRLVNVIQRAMSPDPRHRFSSAEAMGAALAGAGGYPVDSVATPVRPLTRVLDAPPVPPSATYVVAPLRRQRLSPRTRKVAGAVGVLGALAVAALAFALDTTSTTQSPAPDPVSISTSVPAPISAPAVVTPVAPAPAPPPVIEQATQQERGNGNGNGNGNKGNGNKGNGAKGPKG